MQVHHDIFKAYDIRGIYNENLFDETADAIGRAYAKIIQPETVIVGRDGRTSGPALFEKLTNALVDVGVNVIDIGMVSTDMYYFACATKRLPGIMITASHNPKEYNGFKMVKQIPQLLTGDDGITQMRDLILANDFPEPTTKKGTIKKWDIMDEFVEKILSLADYTSFKTMKIIADTANGMVGPSLEALFRHIPQIEVVPMYFEPDGTFPNHGGDPLQVENRREIQERVPSEHADLGVMFDPDGDRFFTIDSRGRFVSGDFMTAIMSEYFLVKSPGSSIVYDIRASQAVPDKINAKGGTPFYNRVGHSYIKSKMMKEDAIFGGEVTGHYYFKDFFFCDSGLAPLMFLLDLLSKSEKTLAEILDEMEQTYHISGEINTKGVDKDKVFSAIEAKYGPSANQLLHVDGVSVYFDDWNFNVRASNTEPLVRLNLEANSDRLMEEKREELLQLIKSYQS
ncbi:MAG: phosphomannomutase/phosphoglucomutase [Microgenomates group bacterium]